MYVFIGLIMNGYGVGYTDSSGNRNRITYVIIIYNNLYLLLTYLSYVTLIPLLIPIDTIKIYFQNYVFAVVIIFYS